MHAKMLKIVAGLTAAVVASLLVISLSATEQAPTCPKAAACSVADQAQCCPQCPAKGLSAMAVYPDSPEALLGQVPAEPVVPGRCCASDPGCPLATAEMKGGCCAADADKPCASKQMCTQTAKTACPVMGGAVK